MEYIFQGGFDFYIAKNFKNRDNTQNYIKNKPIIPLKNLNLRNQQNAMLIIFKLLFNK